MGENESSRLRVIIVGGGVAGLTLANALEVCQLCIGQCHDANSCQQAGVDYVLLERRDDIAPQVGASIGIFPSAARVSDYSLSCMSRSCSVALTRAKHRSWTSSVLGEESASAQ